MKFTMKTPQEVIDDEKHAILNFQNLYSVYLFYKNPIFQKEIMNTKNHIFPDGASVSTILSIKYMRRIPRIIGPLFTKEFLMRASDKKHFIIGLTDSEVKNIFLMFPQISKENIKTYNPPFIKNLVFPKKEIDKIAIQIKNFNPDFVWVGLGNPKQEILANQLYKKYPCFYFNVGAALDYLAGKKKQSPIIFRSLGLEWFYRGITDFKNSNKKILRSFIGLRYLGKIGIEST